MDGIGDVDEVEPSLELMCLLLGMQADPEIEFEARVAAVAGWERLIGWASAMQAEQLLAIDVEADVKQHGWHAADAARSLGDASFWAMLLAEDRAAVYDRLDAFARSSLATNAPGDERPLDARRADSLVQLVGQISNGYRGPEVDDEDGQGEDKSAPPSEPTRHGRRATVHVTVAWSTLIGLGSAPAHRAGYGPIDAATARRITADLVSSCGDAAVRALGSSA